MKKALSISLGQTLFTIEDDAYLRLEAYLNSVRAHFATTTGHEEIIKDIESRIAEQFLETGKTIITIAEVEPVIMAMGTAAEFGGESETGPVPEISAKKKLYRNPDEAMIGGVCAGLAAYLDVDVVWVRLSAVILTLANGIGILIYLVLWTVIPEAKSTAQKLQMSGSPVTVATLSESVKDRAQEAAEKAAPTFRKIIAAPFVAIGIVLRAIINNVFPLIRVLVGTFLTIMSGIGLLALTFFGVLVVSGIEQYTTFPVRELIAAPAYYTLAIGAYLTLMIPALFIFLGAISLIRKKSVLKTSVGFSLLGLWCIALVTTGAVGFKTGYKISEYERTNPDNQLVEVKTDLEDAVVTALEVTDGQKVTLVQGPEASVTKKVRARDQKLLSYNVTDGKLLISRVDSPQVCLFCDSNNSEFIVTVPDLKAITVTEGGRVVNAAWKSNQSLIVSIDNGARAELVATVPALVASVTEGARLDIVGSAVSSTMNADFGARIEAKEFEVQDIKATAKLGARINVHAVKTLEAKAEEGGRIDYIGEPVVTKTTEQGGRIEDVEEPELNLE